MANSEILLSGCIIHLHKQMPKLTIYYKMLFLSVTENHDGFLFLKRKKRKQCYLIGEQHDAFVRKTRFFSFQSTLGVHVLFLTLVRSQ